MTESLFARLPMPVAPGDLVALADGRRARVETAKVADDLRDAKCVVVIVDFPLFWRVKVIRPEWFGRRCRIVVHGGRGLDGRQIGNRLIEFDNGERVVCPGAYLRRAT